MTNKEKKYIKNAIEEREWNIIHLTFQNKWFETENGKEQIGSEKAAEIVEKNLKQVEQIKKEIIFFKTF